MEWINIYGLAIIAIIMLPNIIYAVKCKDGFINKWNNKIVEAVEQIGRFSCFGFMIISVCSITVRRTVIASKPENQALSCLGCFSLKQPPVLPGEIKSFSNRLKYITSKWYNRKGLVTALLLKPIGGYKHEK